jgi:glycosyltransferase involved in cell wall biosynthesis
MLKVLIPINEFPTDINNIRGGVHAALKNLLIGFSKKEIIVRVISFNKEVKQNTIKKFADNIEIHYTFEGALPFHSLNYFFIDSFKLKKHVKAFKPDIIHFEAGDAFLLSQLLINKKIPYLLTIHGIAIAEGKVERSLHKKLSSYFNGFLDKLLFPKNIIHLSNYSKKIYADKKIDNQVIIPNALSEHFYNLQLKSTTENKLIFIGVLNDNKNLLLLLEAMKMLNKKNMHFHLDVLGDFKDLNYKTTIEDFINQNQLQDQVYFHGWVKQSDTLKLIEAADILVLASKQESLPMVIAESMAAGKAIVASNIGGVSEMVQQNINGFLFEPNQVSGLSDCLEKLYKNNNTIQQFSVASNKIASTMFHCNEIAKQTISFYQKILSNNNFKQVF